MALVLAATPIAAPEAKSLNNAFASILIGDKKIGTVHFALTHSDAGDLEELRTRVSYSVLGVTVYAFTQNLRELWKNGELQSVKGNTDDDGKKNEIDLKRTTKGYEGTLDGKPVTLPPEAFPTSLWHYEITKQHLLFQLTDLQLNKVTVKESKDSREEHGKTVPLQRFDFTGDWEATVWYDMDNTFDSAKYKSEGKTVTIRLDP